MWCYCWTFDDPVVRVQELQSSSSCVYWVMCATTLIVLCVLGGKRKDGAGHSSPYLVAIGLSPFIPFASPPRSLLLLAHSHSSSVYLHYMCDRLSAVCSALQRAQ